VTFEQRYHVPRSQVWAGSRGRQSGRVHLHVIERFDVGRIHRDAGQALCGRTGWYERAADADDLASSGVCARCADIAARAGALALGLS
jgi:hypothetical protein